MTLWRCQYGEDEKIVAHQFCSFGSKFGAGNRQYTRKGYVMADYELLTKNGHNFYDIAAMLQNAIRRADYTRAGYAANELFYKYRGYLWKRLLIISAEDCFGIITKEIIALKQAEEQTEKKGQAETIFVSKAITLLCYARKNEDADYFACNQPV